MTNDENKILTHLLYRSCRADSSEIEGAWRFEDFETALLSLVEKGYVKKTEYIDKNKNGCYYCRLTQEGIKVIKEGQR